MGILFNIRFIKKCPHKWYCLKSLTPIYYTKMLYNKQFLLICIIFNYVPEVKPPIAFQKLCNCDDLPPKIIANIVFAAQDGQGVKYIIEECSYLVSCGYISRTDRHKQIILIRLKSFWNIMLIVWPIVSF